MRIRQLLGLSTVLTLGVALLVATSSGVSQAQDDHSSGHMEHMDGDYIDLASFGHYHGNHHNGDDGLVNGRTAITTEALASYNHLRQFVGLDALALEDVGEWAFANRLTNNEQAWGTDVQGVGLFYAMQGAKVGWIADDKYDPQLIADISRTARLGSPAEVMPMIHDHPMKDSQTSWWTTVTTRHSSTP